MRKFVIVATLLVATQANARSFYLNQWGGVNSCSLARTSGDLAYCNGAASAKRNPSKFNCHGAEVVDEYAYCGKRLPL